MNVAKEFTYIIIKWSLLHITLSLEGLQTLISDLARSGLQPTMQYS